MQSWKSGTTSKYGVYLKQWEYFCYEQQIDKYNPSVTDGLKFLNKIFKKGCGYSTINSARSALSTFITIDGFEFGKHPLVSKFLKGVFNMRPSLPKYSFTWDMGKVLDYIQQHPPSNLQELTEKTVTLLALLCGQRAREISAVMDTRNMETTDDIIVIRIGDLLKTSTNVRHTGEVKFPSYPSNNSICPVSTIRQYIENTKEIRGNITSLFLTINKPHHKPSKDTFGRWIKSMLERCGINTTIFKPHSTRSASTSRANTKISTETVLKTGGWRSHRTFAVYYK